MALAQVDKAFGYFNEVCKLYKLGRDRSKIINLWALSKESCYKATNNDVFVSPVSSPSGKLSRILLLSCKELW